MTAQPVRRRDQVAAEDRWNIAAIFPSDEAWETALESARRLPGNSGRSIDVFFPE